MANNMELRVEASASVFSGKQTATLYKKNLEFSEYKSQNIFLFIGFYLFLFTSVNPLIRSVDCS